MSDGCDSLEELANGNIDEGSTYRLEYVLNTLNDAERLDSGLTWESNVWCADGDPNPSCSVEELLGALIEAEQLLERVEGDRE